MSDYGDIFGRYVDATAIMREFLADDGGDLAAWLRDQSRALWGADHREEDWGAVAVRARRLTTRRMDNRRRGVRMGEVVRCPSAGSQKSGARLRSTTTANAAIAATVPGVRAIGVTQPRARGDTIGPVGLKYAVTSHPRTRGLHARQCPSRSSGTESFTNLSQMGIF
jgi:hypothetical protein